MHLWSAAPQQVNKGRVEGHDGVPHVNEVVIIVLDTISVTTINHISKMVFFERRTICLDLKRINK